MRLLGVLVAAGVLAAGAGASAKQDALRLVRVGTFAQPVYLTSAPGDPGSLYVVEQAGRILRLHRGSRSTLLDIRPLVLSGGEQGLLSVAFDPRYATNRRFYVDYTDRNGDTRVVRYTVSGGRANPRSAKLLMFVRDFAANHNGGQLQFGPDGLLYWGNGDGGGAGDPRRNGQSLARPFAKIMRTRVDTAKPNWRLVAYGLRNPWRFSFDRKTHDLWIGDVGQGAYEEIDRLPSPISRVVNFGWNRYEGRHAYDTSTSLLRRGPYVPPVAEYSHDFGCSVSGGYVYRGTKVPSAAGRYFYGDYCSGIVWSLTLDGGRAQVRREPFVVRGLSSFGEDAAGELYLMSVDSGALYRLA